MEERVLFLDQEMISLAEKNFCERNQIAHVAADNTLVLRQWLVYPQSPQEEQTIAIRVVSSETRRGQPASAFAEVVAYDASCGWSKELGRTRRESLGGIWTIPCQEKEVTLRVIPISPARMLQTAKAMIEDIRDTWSGGMDDVKAASTLTAAELQALGYPAE